MRVKTIGRTIAKVIIVTKRNDPRMIRPSFLPDIGADGALDPGGFAICPFV